MLFDRDFITQLLDKATVSERLRQHLDLRNSASDTSQRMLNALLPGTEVPIHRHEETAETVVCLHGKLEEVLYEEVGDGTFREVSRQLLSPKDGLYGMQIPAGVWHRLNPPSSLRPKTGLIKGDF